MKQARGEKNQASIALRSMETPNGNQPATKADIAVLDGKIVVLDQKMDRMHDDLVEKMRDTQTEVLRAFHSWARPTEIRLRSLDDVQQRLGLLEERVSAIERGDKPAA